MKGRISGDGIEDLTLDDPGVPRAGFEAAVAHEAKSEPADPRPTRSVA